MTKKTTHAFLSFVFLMAIAMGAHSQQSQNFKNASLVKKEVKADNPNSRLVYYNYRGITNLADAKSAWIKDHPGEYKTLTNYKPKAKSTSTLYSDPNKQRRLPAHYDDSKTNSSSKN